MNSLEIRIAGVEDLPEVLRLYAQPDFDDGAILPLEEAVALHTMFEAYPSYKLYVAAIEGRIVGTFALLIMHNLGHRGAPSAIIEDVVVDRRLQGKGIGKAMMRNAMQSARERGCYKLVLSSNDKRTIAHAFYEKLGFKRHGISLHVTFTVE